MKNVVPRKGDVDRNSVGQGQNVLRHVVVPRKGDVDRNAFPSMPSAEAMVVPRKGDVDRNNERFFSTEPPDCRPPQGGRG